MNSLKRLISHFIFFIFLTILPLTLHLLLLLVLLLDPLHLIPDLLKEFERVGTALWWQRKIVIKLVFGDLGVSVEEGFL